MYKNIGLGELFMEKLAWMRKIDGSMEKLSLLQLIDSMHEVIDVLITNNQEKEALIKQLKESLEQKSL